MKAAARPTAVLGQAGEAAAALYLEQRGYRILARNYRCRYGEIDLVADGEGCLVFVEVKTRLHPALEPPQLAVTEAKQARLRRLGAYYLAHDLGAEAARLQPRFDVIAVLLPRTILKHDVLKYDVLKQRALKRGALQSPAQAGQEPLADALPDGPAEARLDAQAVMDAAQIEHFENAF